MCFTQIECFYSNKKYYFQNELDYISKTEKKPTKIQMEFRKNKSRNIVRLILSYANFYQVPFFFQFELFLIPFKWLNYIL